jgi:hypothetical protein
MERVIHEFPISYDVTNEFLFIVLIFIIIFVSL